MEWLEWRILGQAGCDELPGTVRIERVSLLLGTEDAVKPGLINRRSTKCLKNAAPNIFALQVPYVLHTTEVDGAGW